MKNKTILYISFLLIIIPSLIIMFGDRLIDIDGLETKIATITAIIGVVALWFQFKREKDFAEAEYILDLNSAFAENPNIKNIYNKLIKYRDTKENQFTLDDKNDLIEYLSFFSPIANLVSIGILSYKTINGFLSFRFFAIINNPQVQQIATIPQSNYIGIIYELYDGWVEYLNKNNIEEPFKENSLRKNYPEYKKFIKRDN